MLFHANRSVKYICVATLYSAFPLAAKLLLLVKLIACIPPCSEPIQPAQATRSVVKPKNTATKTPNFFSLIIHLLF